MPVYEKQDYWVKESIRDKAFEEFYCLGKELGRCQKIERPNVIAGATSCVFKCAHRGTDMNWAVKIITKNVDKKVVSAEIGILLQMDSPYVIRLKEVFETPTQIFLVLELVTGGELFDRIVSRGTYTERDAANAIADILSGVKYLHSRGVVHRDLKPENLLYESMTDQSKLKIADFGLSRIIESEVKMSTVCGTPGYCAPEVLLGQEYDKAADLWSVGVIAYILLCGYEPFFSENESDMYRKIINGQYQFETEYWSEISENAKDLVRKLLVVDPKKRLSASQALNLPWVQCKATKNDKMEETVEKIKEFNARRRLKLPLSYYDKFEDYLTREKQRELQNKAHSLVAKGKGMLAVDLPPDHLETVLEGAAGTVEPKELKRLYRELIIDCEESMPDYLSAVLLSEEALYQKDSIQVSFVRKLKEKDIRIGVLIDKGLAPLAGSHEEFTTEGLDNLAEECLRYKRLGAHLAVWRCVYKVSPDTPSVQAMAENAEVLARFASVCQQNDVLPVLFPDVLSDGDHSLQVAECVTQQALSFLFKALSDHHVLLEATLLKLRMVIAGKDCQTEVHQKEIVHATVTTLKRSIPPAVAGIFFACGELTEEDSLTRLDAVNKHEGGFPWALSFCVGETLQDYLAELWQGKEDQEHAVQQELVACLKVCTEAALGECIVGMGARVHPQLTPALRGY